MKSLDGLSLEDKLAKVVSQLAESEAQNVQLRQKAGQVDVLTKANAQLEKKLDKANQVETIFLGRRASVIHQRFWSITLRLLLGI